jgi:osmotically-inducible protein OsmY
VVLTGWASSAAEAQTAASIARNTKGVKSVDNQLKVKE